MATTFEELEGSPTFSFDDGKFTGTRKFKVAWEDWATFVGELYGLYTVTGGTVVSTSPAHFPGVPAAVCVAVKGGPQQGLAPIKQGTITLTNDNAARYTHAFVTATYKIPFSQGGQQGRGDLPGVPEGTYLDFSSDHGAEYMTTPGRVWQWVSDSEALPDDQSPGLIMPTEDIALTWSRVTSPPWNAIRDAKGKINTSTFLNFPAKKVLFVGARARKSFQLTEQTFWTLDYQFRVRAEEWNKIYRKGTGFADIQAADTSDPPYDDTNFSSLFAFG